MAGVAKAFQCLNTFYEKLRDNDDCSLECSCVLLGALTKQMSAKGFQYPLPATPYLGYSVAEVVADTCDVKDLKWLNKSHIIRSNRRHYKPRYNDDEENTCGCSLDLLIVPTIGKVLREIEGLKLKTFTSSGTISADSEKST